MGKYNEFKKQLKECSPEMMEHSLKSWQDIVGKLCDELDEAETMVTLIKEELRSRKKYKINMDLANKFGLTEDQINEIQIIGDRLMYALENPDSFEDIIKTVRQLEFELQSAWGFVEDEKFHRYQTEIKGCTCGKMDNQEWYWGTGLMNVDLNCKIHGKLYVR